MNLAAIETERNSWLGPYLSRIILENVILFQRFTNRHRFGKTGLQTLVRVCIPHFVDAHADRWLFIYNDIYTSQMDRCENECCLILRNHFYFDDFHYGRSPTIKWSIILPQRTRNGAWNHSGLSHFAFFQLSCMVKKARTEAFALPQPL